MKKIDLEKNLGFIDIFKVKIISIIGKVFFKDICGI
jgi:hypothetical protein